MLYPNDFFFFWLPVLKFLNAVFHGLRLSFPCGGKLLSSKLFYCIVCTMIFAKSQFLEFVYLSVMGMICTLLQKVLLKKQAAWKRLEESYCWVATTEITAWNSQVDWKVKMSYTWQLMVFFLVRIIREQATRIILCFSIFSQLWLQPLGTDINSYSLEQFYEPVRKVHTMLLSVDKRFSLCTVSAAPSWPRLTLAFSIYSFREDETSIVIEK